VIKSFFSVSLISCGLFVYKGRHNQIKMVKKIVEFKLQIYQNNPKNEVLWKIY